MVPPCVEWLVRDLEWSCPRWRGRVSDCMHAFRTRHPPAWRPAALARARERGSTPGRQEKLSDQSETELQACKIWGRETSQTGGGGGGGERPSWWSLGRSQGAWLAGLGLEQGVCCRAVSTQWATCLSVCAVFGLVAAEAPRPVAVHELHNRWR